MSKITLEVDNSFEYTFKFPRDLDGYDYAEQLAYVMITAGYLPYTVQQCFKALDLGIDED